MIEFIQARTPALDIPWLASGRDLGNTLLLQRGKRKETEDSTKGREKGKERENKQEKESDAMGVVESAAEVQPKPPKLQPLRIKQVTAKRPRLGNK